MFGTVCSHSEQQHISSTSVLPINTRCSPASLPPLLFHRKTCLRINPLFWEKNGSVDSNWFDLNYATSPIFASKVLKIQYQKRKRVPELFYQSTTNILYQKCWISWIQDMSKKNNCNSISDLDYNWILSFFISWIFFRSATIRLTSKLIKIMTIMRIL